MPVCAFTVQVEALRDDLVLALRQLEPALAFSKTAAEAPTKLLACVLQLHDLHLSASKLLWQCGLSAQSITGKDPHPHNRTRDPCLSIDAARTFNLQPSPSTQPSRALT